MEITPFMIGVIIVGIILAGIIYSIGKKNICPNCTGDCGACTGI